MGKLLDRRGAGCLLNGYNPTESTLPAGVTWDGDDMNYLKWGDKQPPTAFNLLKIYSGFKEEDPTKTDGAWFPTAAKDRCFKKKGSGPVFIYFRMRVEFTMEFWGEGIFGPLGSGLYFGSRDPANWFGNPPPWPAGTDYIATSNADVITYVSTNYDPSTGLPVSYDWEVTSQSVDYAGTVSTSTSTETQPLTWLPTISGYTAWYGGPYGYYYKESGPEIHSADLTFRPDWGVDVYTYEPFNIIVRDDADSEDVPAYDLTEASGLIIYPSTTQPSLPTRFVAYTTDVTDFSYLRTRHKTRLTLQARVVGGGTLAHTSCDCWFKDKTYTIKVKWQEGEVNVTQTGTGYLPLYEQITWNEEHTETLTESIDLEDAVEDIGSGIITVDLWVGDWDMDAGTARRLIDVWVESIE